MRIVVCDDDQQIIEEYSKTIKEIAAEQNISAEVEGMVSGERLLFELSDDPNQVDLIYMDINFGDKMDGIVATKQLREMGYRNDIVFLTVDRERVFESFDAGPMHYVVKGETTRSKFAEIFLQAHRKAERRSKEVIALSCAGENRNIPLDSIRYFEVVRRIIEVHYDDEVFEFYSTIGKLENMLLEKGFIRVHRAYLVSQAHVTAIKSTEITMDNGDVIPVGRTYAKDVRARLQERTVL